MLFGAFGSDRFLHLRRPQRMSLPQILLSLPSGPAEVHKGLVWWGCLGVCRLGSMEANGPAGVVVWPWDGRWGVEPCRNREVEEPLRNRWSRGW